MKLEIAEYKMIDGDFITCYRVLEIFDKTCHVDIFCGFEGKPSHFEFSRRHPKWLITKQIQDCKKTRNL